MKKNNLQQLIKKLKFNYVNSDITEDNFPDDGQRGKVEIIDFKRTISSEEALKEMGEKGLRPATVYEMLNWAEDNWNGIDWIVALGSVWRRRDGGRHVPCLGGFGSGRDLGLGWVEGDWLGFCRFAAVRKVASELEPLNPSDFEARILALESFEKKVREVIKL